MAETYHLIVNDVTRAVTVDGSTKLLYVLRNDFGLVAAKFGCGLGECKACTVLVEGVPTLACMSSVAVVAGRRITTLEGLGSEQHPHPLQAAFIEEQAAQCGYCSNGMIMTAKAFLDDHPHPTADEVKQALDGNICRCGTHNRVVRAVLTAAKTMEGGR